MKKECKDKRKWLPVVTLLVLSMGMYLNHNGMAFVNAEEKYAEVVNTGNSDTTVKVASIEELQNAISAGNTKIEVTATMEISNETTIALKEATSIVSSNNMKNTMFKINSTGKLTISGNVEIDGKSIARNAPIVVNNGVLTLSEGVTIIGGNNQSEGTGNHGGAVYNGGTLKATSAVLSENTSKGDGGAIYNYGTLNLSKCVFQNNQAVGSNGLGGAIINYGTLTMDQSEIKNNQAYLSGGGIYHSGNSASIINSIISNNGDGGDGIDGNLYSCSPITITGGMFTGNRSQKIGGMSFESNVLLQKNIDISDSVTIAQNAKVTVASDAAITIASGAIVDVNGILSINTNGKVSGNGKIRIENTGNVSGSLANIADVEAVLTIKGTQDADERYCKVGSTVTVNGGYDENTKTFDYWKSNVNLQFVNGTNKNSQVIKFVMPQKSVVLTAVYKKNALAKKGQVYTVNDIEYKVTAATKTKCTVTLVKCKKKVNGKLGLPASVKICGYSYRVTEIGKKAFYKNTKLSTIVIPKYVTKIEDSAFYGCSSLGMIRECENLKTIENKAFYNCKKLRTIPVMNKLETLGSSSFAKCTSLKTITLGKHLKTIGKNTFYDDNQLKTIIIESKQLKSVGSNALKGIYKKATIKVPSSKVKTYKKLFAKKGQSKTVQIKKL